MRSRRVKETWKSCTCTSVIRAAPSRPVFAMPLPPREAGWKISTSFSMHKSNSTRSIAKAACSAHIDIARIGVDHIVRPELRDCRTICIANKQGNDCIYFAGIKLEPFIFFLKEFNYPEETISFVEKNRSMLDHLEYDVGFDYRMERKRSGDPEKRLLWNILRKPTTSA